ncbi:hypothetical protein [Streptomyces sp. NBC_00239]|uniref:hypothetical protein n=1 Tax=Streptomyces sp. NBC_00239 TaxID=2903640 RepID=UPI002E2B57D8|nr:hypothetical protein [Streptomyces sp. NBC_00239]
MCLALSGGSTGFHTANPATAAAATGSELTRLAALYHSSLDWDDPAGPSPWPREQQEAFRREADTALRTLRRELGDGWAVEDRR